MAYPPLYRHGRIQREAGGAVSKHAVEWAFDQLEHPFGNRAGAMSIIGEFARALLDAQRNHMFDPRTRSYWGA